VADSTRGLADAADVLGNRSRPDTPWISKVTGCTVEEAERAVAEVAEHAAVIAELAEKVRRTGRSYYAQFPAPMDLFAMVRLTKPRNLVESGVASGVSSAFMLMGIKANSMGVLHSIDMPVQRTKRRGNEPWAIPPGMSSGWAIPARLRRGWDLRQGRSEDLLEPLLGAIGTLDFYCHDSPVDVKHFEFEMKAIIPRLGPGSLVVADNTDREIFDRAAQAAGATPWRRKSSSLAGFRIPGRVGRNSL
jgi:hypothetical protein